MKITNFTKGKKFEVELADTIQKQAVGLSFSSRKRNMLFRFKLPIKLGFWMFGMRYDIWISFLDDKGMVFGQFKAVKMTLNPATWRVYKPTKACKYVLETTDKLVDVGDVLKF